MSYKLKTLIVFDTNSLRSTEVGDVAYSFFAFGRPFQVVENFIIDNKLDEDIHLAIPDWAIEELKDQKQLQYEKDILEFEKLVTRLSGLPHIPEITIQKDSFDCKTYIQEEATKFFTEKQFKRLQIREEIAGDVLKSMMTRVLKEEKFKKPFAHSGKYKDAGFKDNIVWESLMNYEDIASYDKFIFVTKDSDYGDCQNEFKEKWNKHIVILKDENSTVTEITKDYELYISERTLYDYSQTDYFKEYLEDELKQKTEIIIDGKQFKIENFKLTDLCTYIERMPPSDEDEKVIMHSTVTIFYSDKGKKMEEEIQILTVFADDETLDITETIFMGELI